MAISLDFTLKMVLFFFSFSNDARDMRIHWPNMQRENEKNSEGAYIFSVNISLLRKLRIQNSIKHSHAQRLMQLFAAGLHWLSLLAAIISTIFTRWLAFCWLQTIPVFLSFAFINWKHTRISWCVLVSPIQFYSLVFFFSSFVLLIFIIHLCTVCI